MSKLENLHMKVHFIGSKKLTAQNAVQELVDKYGQTDPTDAAVICAVGGDGTILNALHTTHALKGTPVFGMRLPDSVGALGNTFQIAALEDRLQKARPISFRSLRAEAATARGETVICSAINEIVVSRARLQTAKLRVNVEGLWTGQSLIGDGLLISTAIGSGGYNLAAGGPLLPWTSGLLALTGIVVRPSSEWRNTVVDERIAITVEVVDPQYRPVRLETSFQEIQEVNGVRISRDDNSVLTLLVDQ
jgi:NAD+ kinase